MLRRLQRLYHHGYVERPACQIDYYQRGGSRSIAYGLRIGCYFNSALKISSDPKDLLPTTMN